MGGNKKIKALFDSRVKQSSDRFDESHKYLGDSIIRSYANLPAPAAALVHHGRRLLPLKQPFQSVPASRTQYSEGCCDKACNTGSVLTEWQAGTHFLLLLAFLWSHLLCNIAVLFTRNCYQRWEKKKNTHQKKKKRSHALSSWSLFPVSACQPKYCLIQSQWAEASANRFKDWGLCLQREQKGRTPVWGSTPLYTTSTSG